MTTLTTTLNVSDVMPANDSGLIEDNKAVTGRSFLATLVKKPALNKTIAPKGHDKKIKIVETQQTEPHYQNYSDIIQNMSQKNPMSLKDMRQLQENIKKLDQEAHIEICRMLVEEQEYKESLKKSKLNAKGHTLSKDSGKSGDTDRANNDQGDKTHTDKEGVDAEQVDKTHTSDDQVPEFTVNNYGTYFDLVDLSSELLWKIHYYVNLSLEDLERQKVKVAAQKQWNQDQVDNPQYQKMKHQLGKDRSQNIFHQALPSYSIDKLPSYEDLREDALRNLKQSQQPIMSNLRDEENSEDYDNPDSIRLGADVGEDTTEIGEEPSELDDFD